MKKLTIILFVLILSFSLLTSCDGGKESSESSEYEAVVATCLLTNVEVKLSKEDSEVIRALLPVERLNIDDIIDSGMYYSFSFDGLVLLYDMQEAVNDLANHRSAILSKEEAEQINAILKKAFKEYVIVVQSLYTNEEQELFIQDVYGAEQVLSNADWVDGDKITLSADFLFYRDGKLAIEYDSSGYLKDLEKGQGAMLSSEQTKRMNSILRRHFEKVGKTVSLEKAQQITPGMTYEQVRELLHNAGIKNDECKYKYELENSQSLTVFYVNLNNQLIVTKTEIKQIEIMVYKNSNHRSVYLSEQDAVAIESILNNYTWEGGKPSAEVEYLFTFPDMSLTYSSTGIFTDAGRFIILSSTQANKINSILERCLSGKKATLENAQRIVEGMTYEQVCEILGDEGFNVGWGFVIYEFDLENSQVIKVWFTQQNEKLIVTKAEIE